MRAMQGKRPNWPISFELPCNNSRVVGYSESAGINRHVVGDERALQERKQRIHPGLESCRRHREVALEA